MEWLKGNLGLPMWRQISPEICRRAQRRTIRLKAAVILLAWIQNSALCAQRLTVCSPGRFPALEKSLCITNAHRLRKNCRAFSNFSVDILPFA